MSNNPFNSIIELYTKSVEKADSAGLAEAYKQATEAVFNSLKEKFSFDITITDVEYLDGYFIFGRGTNSVVHFHINETPGWKYGIWWAPIEDEDTKKPYTDRVHCSIFAQYEEEIDKFKPSASMICEEFTIDFKHPTANRLWAFVEDIKFIHDEPYLAFYREMNYTDFNREYVSRAKAKSYFERYFKQKRLAEETKALNNKEMLKTIYGILKEDIDEGTCFIVDRGDSCSPRYNIIVKNTFGIEDGCYRLWDFFEEPNTTELKRLWDNTVAECNKRANKAKCCWWWSSCCHESVDLISADAYDTGFAQFKKVDFNKEPKNE